MAQRALGAFLSHLTGAAVRAGGEPDDADLLDRFVRGREEAAFAALLGRHGPMVWGVCRRVLRNEADGEDASQATFLVSARKAGSTPRRASLASWLYGVASRSALKARARNNLRAAKEREAATRPRPEGADPAVERFLP